MNIHLLSTIAHFIHNKYCCTSSGTRPICTPVTKDQLSGAGCMCDTALARLCPNKEGLYREFQAQERRTSGGELWPKVSAFPTKCSRCWVSLSLSFPFPQNLVYLQIQSTKINIIWHYFGMPLSFTAFQVTSLSDSQTKIAYILMYADNTNVVISADKIDVFWWDLVKRLDLTFQERFQFCLESVVRYSKPVKMLFCLISKPS